MMEGSGDRRKKALHLVQDNPGLHLRALGRLWPASFNSLRHHLDGLEREGAVRVESETGYKRYFAAPISAPSRRAAMALRQRQMRRILLAALERPGLRASEAAASLGLAESTVSAYVRRLRALGVLTGGPGLTVADAAALREAMALLRPTLMDRLVDAALAVFDDADRARSA